MFRHSIFKPLLIAASLLLLVCTLRLFGIAITIATFATWLLYTAPGYLFLRALKAQHSASLLAGSVLGHAVVGLFLTFSIHYFGWNLLTLISTYALLVLTAWWLGCCWQRSTANPVEFITLISAPQRNLSANSRQLFAFFVTLWTALLVYGFSTAGELTPSGYAFTGIFSHDYLLRAMSAVMVADQIPPKNYFFHGQELYNYYVNGYIFPALAIKLTGLSQNPRTIFSAYSIVSMLTFAGILWLFVGILSEYIKSKNPANQKNNLLIWFGGLTLFCYSSYWAFFSLKKMVHIGYLPQLTSLTNSMNYVSQSWLRDSFYEPQSVIAVSMIVLVLLTIKSQEGWQRGGFIGIVVAALAMTDTGIFLIFFSAYIVFISFGILSKRSVPLIRDLIATCVVGILICLGMISVGIIAFSKPSNQLIFQVNPTVLLGLPVLLLLQFGLLILAGIAGIRLLTKKQMDPLLTLLVLLTVTSLLCGLFLTDALEGNVMLRKAFKVMRLPLLAFAAIWLTTRPFRQQKLWALALISTSLPTLFTDMAAITVHQGFSPTTYVSPGEMAATSWIKQNTLKDDVVQGLIDHSGAFDYSPTVEFAERPAAMAHWKIAYLMYPNREELSNRSAQIDRLLDVEDGKSRYQLAQQLAIDYLYIGTEERRQHPNLLASLAKETEFFSQVYYNDGAAVFKVNKK